MALDGSDPRALMVPDISRNGWGIGSPEAAVADWAIVLAPLKVFRVRGFSWFKRQVSRNVTDLAPFIPAMQAAVRTRAGWTDLTDFDWKEALAARQAYDAAAGKLLQFSKAAKVLLLCELAAAANDIPATVVYTKMRIEPAVFGITDFTRAFLDEAIREREDILSVLRRGTAQETQGVFYDMADGYWVSYRLAETTRRVLKASLTRQRAGDVIVPLTRAKRSSSLNEKAEGPSVPAAAA